MSPMLQAIQIPFVFTYVPNPRKSIWTKYLNVDVNKIKYNTILILSEF